MGQMERLWNEGTKQHSKQKCTGHLSMVKQEQRIISTIWQLQCHDCGFTGEPMKMFVEAKTMRCGQKQSTLNTALGCALINSPIGSSQWRRILLTLGINPGSDSGTQALVSACAQLVENMVEASLARERAKLRRFPSISVSCDARYDSKISSTSTPFQAASQCTFTTVESKSKKVIHFVSVNKICLTGQRLRAQGQDVTCPGGHKGCTANIKFDDSIGREGYYA